MNPLRRPACTCSALAAMALALTVAGCPGSAPAPGPNPYLPLAAGKAWTYALVTTTQAGELRGTATLACKGGGPGGFTLSWAEAHDGAGEGGEDPSAYEVATSASTISLVRAPHFLPVIVPADFDARKRTFRVGRPGGADEPYEIASEVAGEEQVTTPAGSHAAVKVRGSHSDSHARYEYAAWYAKDVGLVKAVVEGTVSAAGMTQQVRIEIALVR